MYGGRRVTPQVTSIDAAVWHDHVTDRAHVTPMDGSPHPARSTAPTILVVEDDAVVRELLAEVLAADGYQVRCATHGGEALNILEAEPIHLVLSDIMMPHLDGLALLRLLRAGRNPPPVVLMSALPPAEVRELASAYVLAKPFDLVELLQLVETILHSRPP